MTDSLDRDRILGTDMILAEVKQFRRLAPLGLPDHEIAHRMAISETDVRRVRQLIGDARARLKDMDLSYHIRFMLGQQGIATLGDLLTWPDAKLLAVHGIGEKTLHKIKRAICAHMGVTEYD